MTTIVSVTEREPKGKPWWLIKDADGVKYATRNCYLASLAKRYMDLGTRVEFGSSSGWWYRDLYSIKPEGQEAVVG